MFISLPVINITMADRIIKAEVVSSTNTSSYKEGEKKARLTALLIILILFLSSVSATYILLREKHREEIIPEPLEAKIVVSRTIVNVSESVVFDATKSTGDIIQYYWDFDATVDRDGDGNPRNDADALGPVVTHAFNTYGSFRVTLTVKNSTEEAKAFVRIHVGYYGEFSGTVSPTKPKENFTFPVVDTIDCSRVRITVTYPSGSHRLNDLNITLYDGNGTMADDTSDDPKDSGDEQTEVIDVNSLQELAGLYPGTWAAEVSYVLSAPTSPAIDFNIVIEVYY